ncbi:conserved exported hypothetical protein [uncultured Eubacteriales bacterium]|uniref:SLH domain-containing protein n=1 Tax=uncultured Eubacteriales bacterium TaxID=172733 RepID=A0A212K0L6_9FIRM|nr:conserved exported hypothetical protein [uncultured Eubacteriales bacterium]
MKKLAAFLLAGLILLGGAAALAAGGSASDPLITQSYITGTYIPATVTTAAGRMDTALTRAYDDAAARLKAQADLYLAKAGAMTGGEGYASTFTEKRFKRGDIITFDTGSQVLLLAGSAALSYDKGAAVDATAGMAASAGAAMEVRHRYLAAEDSLCRVTVTSDTAVISLQGYYALTSSSETDYNELADALKAMGLFKGTGTAYGDGYDLEQTPTRIEGLVLFLRLIGEEKAALAYTGTNPFTDVPDWARQYVAYAYAKGYTKGVDEDLMRFGTTNIISSGEYLTFLLRALGYQDSGTSPDFTWDTALDRAKDLGVITTGERALFDPAKPFFRAQTAYLSYYALSASRKAGGTLQNALISAGAMTQTQAEQAKAGVTGARLR